MSGDRNRLHLSASRAFVKKLEAAKMALSHVTPGASMEQVFEAGLDLILARDAKKRALVPRPRPAKDPKLLRFDSRAKDLRVCCRPHNGIHADQVFGRAYMERFRRRGRPQNAAAATRSARRPAGVTSPR